jgi:hypothetical protein
MLEYWAEIWDALRAAAEADIHLAQAIVDSAGIIVQSEDLSTCYDERGIIKKTLSFPLSLLPKFILVSVSCLSK